jgi:phosphatidylserine decarboxylase precursor-related protein
MSKKGSQSTPPWYRAKFDLEGLGFGGLALALAILVGGIPWVGGILSFIFWIALIVILFASRDCERTSPVGKELILSPCDGVVVDISNVAPPREVRWDTPEVKRVRISSSPFSVNGVRAPLTGNVESFLEEEGAPAALALNADNSDLREAFMLFSGEEGVTAIRLATGGLGPRLDIDLEPGDGVRAGRKIGVRRLGGWCDVYLPLNAETALIPGMSVIGGETILSDLSDVEVDHKPFVDASVVVETESVSADESDADVSEVSEEQSEPDAIEEKPKS